jgi:hypothetical protein
MSDTIRILFLSANPGPTGRILVDEEAREISNSIQEGPYRDRFELHKHTAIRPSDLQKLLLKHRPHIVHFSAHGHRSQRLILGGAPGRAKTVDKRGLAQVFALYRHHVRLVVLNACFTDALARSITKAVDYSVGTGKGIGDKASVVFAGAFYRALGFGNSVNEAFASAKAEIGLTRTPRAQGIELFVRNSLTDQRPFPCLADTESALTRIAVRYERRVRIFETLSIARFSKRIELPARRRGAVERLFAAGLVNSVR